MRHLVCISALVLLAPVAAVAGLDCAFFDSHMGATFDLGDLERTGEQPVYAVEDGDIPCTTKTIEKNYTYVFNICGTIDAGSMTVPSVCSSMPGMSTAAAIQIDRRANSDPNDDWCFVVGSYSEKTTQVALLDDNDPTKGVQITYYGDYCSTPRVQRQFKLELMCADKLNPVPLHALEYEHCVYTVTIPSVYGCPIECPVSERKLCGGNGHCAYDYDSNAARCFCNHGYSGSSCTENSSSSSKYSSAMLGLIITLFVIIGILVASVVLMIRQVAAYRDDIANYQLLKGGEDEMGSAVV